MTKPKFRLFVAVLGAGAWLGLAPLVAATAPVKASMANAAWNPLFDYDNLDVKPVPVEQKPPLYPAELKTRGVKAKVAVELIIGKQGNVEAAQVLSSTDSRFNDACIAAALKWRFTVPKKKDQAVYCRASQWLSFD